MEQTENINEVYAELMDIYEKGMNNQDAALLTNFVRDGRVLMFKQEENIQQYIDLRLKRADTFGLFGKFTEAIKEYRLAIAMCEPQAHWEIYLAWCQSLYLKFILSKDDEELKSIASDIISIAAKGKKSIITGKDKEYRQMSLAHFEAFFLAYLGDKTKAKAVYSGFKFKPVPITQINNENELTYLMSNYAKGLAVAIELEDVNLLEQLLKVISIDDQVLYGEKNLFKKFHTTLLHTMDMRPEFTTDLNQLFAINDKLMTPMKQLSFFLTSIQANMLSTLDGFFNGFKK